MSTATRKQIPAPFLAAAGAGDLAYQQLRKHLPAAVEQLSRRAAELRGRGDVQQLRADARTVLHKAGERAGEVYRGLVVRGEQVVSHATEPAGTAKAGVGKAGTARGGGSGAGQAAAPGTHHGAAKPGASKRAAAAAAEVAAPDELTS